MESDITAIFENGILRPLTPLNLKEHEKVDLKIIKRKSVVRMTKGMVKGNSRYLKEIAESEIAVGSWLMILLLWHR